jgi:predicted DNA-binding ArsR family transcriptional regulator
MNIEDKKKKILEKLYQTNDEEILDIVYSLLEPESTYHTTAPASEAELKAVLEGLEDIKNGNVVSDEEVQKNPDKWLDE